jgi:hypothetical protein
VRRQGQLVLVMITGHSLNEPLKFLNAWSWWARSVVTGREPWASRVQVKQ